MRAVCFQSIEQVSVDQVDDPHIEQRTDAIVQVEVAGLCGSDLHPFHGREVGLDPGTVMGHEFVGRVVEIGSDVKTVTNGRRVLAPFSTSCGSCFFCKNGLSSRCERGQLFGWKSDGKGLHGCQAELVRVPLADRTLVALDDCLTPEFALLLGDNLTTGYYCAQMADVQPGRCYVVLGCGTVGLLCISAALKLDADWLLAYDPNPRRAALAESFGARSFSDPDELADALHSATAGRGADAVMELVGLPEAQAMAYRLLRPGGILSAIGCHCAPHFAFSPTDAYDKNLTYRTGRCPVRSMVDKVQTVFQSDQDGLAQLISHRFPLAAGVEAYDTFANRKDGCQKAVLEM